MLQELCKYFMLFMIYSTLGWTIEIILTPLKSKKFINRGFFIGPYCPIYGIGVLLIIILLNKYQKDPIALFIMAMIICALLEYLTSFLMEVIFKNRWWDYSDKKFNINGRICLEYMIPFGIGATVIYYLLNPFFLKLIELINPTILVITSITIFILFLIDVIISLNIITKITKVSKTIKTDSTEEITTKVKEILTGRSMPHRRLVKAFPGMKIRNKTKTPKSK